ncbi:crotonase/enoyl-CoA hydratase family protein [Alteromonas facilis]|uniref:crotonase/enoyl-CoA hydratase family protein n=1 Tax=Alteromonas facilis TaxID=2048004 RepID=UPI000C282540|nr:crotonase/enoyl-CoA hydratase family protein [Alteromonas facilis]
MDSARVTLEVRNHIGYVTLNRPDKHNALDMAMFIAIDNVISQIKRDKTIRVVIVNGAGESFCSGLDIKSVLSSAGNAFRLLFKWLPGNANLAQRVTVGWRRLKVPVIMVLHGKCWGGGMQIALGADFRIASSDCSLSIMESRWGLIPDMGGTLGLRECVANDHATKLAMTSETLSADEAHNIGLITTVNDQPMHAAETLAQQLISRSPDAISTIKRIYHKIWCRHERRILAAESINQIRVILGKNQRIAVKREMGHTNAEYKL